MEFYHASLQTSLEGIDAAMERVRQAISSRSATDASSAEPASEMADLEHDLNFLRVGKSVHNVHYADSLVRALATRLGDLCRELEISPPDIVLPEMEGSEASEKESEE